MAAVVSAVGACGCVSVGGAAACWGMRRSIAGLPVICGALQRRIRPPPCPTCSPNAAPADTTVSSALWVRWGSRPHPLQMAAQHSPVSAASPIFATISFLAPGTTGQRPQATRLDFLLRMCANRKAAQQNGRHVDHRGEAGIGKGQQVHNAPRAKKFCRALPEGSARRNCKRQKEAGGRNKRAGGKQQETKQSKHQM